MNLKVFDDYKTGVSKISPTGAFQVHDHTLIFIDEASMIDGALYEYIHKGTDKSCKIIYLGDRCQLAPVFEKISSVYRNQKRTSELETPVRNAAQPALMALCDRLRKNVDTLGFQATDPVPGVIEYLDDAQAKAFIETTFATETSKARALCYINARVTEYSEYIRNLRGYPPHFVPGERVINTTGTQIDPKNLLRVEEEFEIREVSSQPETVPFAKNTAAIDVYKVKIVNPYRGTLSVRIPASPERHKQLMRHFAGQKDWPTFYWLKNSFPDLRPKDAATAYKAQGSTYETVFLDLGSIGKCTDDDQVARMLCVGAARVTTRLVLYGQLPARFANRGGFARCDGMRPGRRSWPRWGALWRPENKLEIARNACSERMACRPCSTPDRRLGTLSGRRSATSGIDRTYGENLLAGRCRSRSGRQSLLSAEPHTPPWRTQKVVRRNPIYVDPVMELLTPVVDSLLADETKRLDKVLQDLILRNHSLGGHKDAFIHHGEIFHLVPRRHFRADQIKALHPSLAAATEGRCESRPR